MTVRWITTGVDADGNEIGYNYDDSTGESYDDMGNLFDYSQDNWTNYGSVDPNSVAGNIAQETSNAAAGAYGGTSNIPSGTANAITAALNKLFGTNLSDKDITTWAPLIAGAAGALGIGRADQRPVGYQGGIPTLVASRSQIPGAVEQPGTRAYGEGARGRQYFTPTTFSAAPKTPAAGTPTTPTNPTAPTTPVDNNPLTNPPEGILPDYQNRATGGILSLAKGGDLSEGGFVIPADVVSHLGNGSSEAGLRLLAEKMGATPIKGEGDGMSDSIKTSIDGERPARVANDEAYLAPNKVAAIGGGDMSKGAKRLYAMMDKIREARTGSKEQGKQINPEKFVPGGKVQGYAEGGTTTPSAAAINSGLTGTESNLSNWAGPYVTDMLAQGQALADQPYQAYTGQLTAGASPLTATAQTQMQNWAQPQGIADAATNLSNIASTTPTPYTSGTFTNQFTAPTAPAAAQFTNQFQAPAETAATQFTNQYTAPTPYTAGAFSNTYTNPLSAADTATTQFNTGIFGLPQAQFYMNPYLRTSLDPQLAEARRQADITGLADRARLAKAGAYGGSRQAIMESEGNRNLATNLANITGAGYNTAYTNAMAQFNADQARALQAQQATEASRQFGVGQRQTGAQTAAQYGLAAQQAAEQSRQFGASQAANAAQLQAQYGLSAQQANEAARQFTQGQRMTAAQMQAQYGLSADQANEMARQFGAQQGMTAAQLGAQYGLASQQAGEQSKQFGANLGLQGLQQQLAAAQAQGQLGLSSGQLGLAGIQQLGQFGAQQQATEQASLDALRQQFEAERDNPYKMVQFQQSLLQGMPLAAQNYATTQTTGLQEALGGATGVAALLKSLGYSV